MKYIGEIVSNAIDLAGGAAVSKLSDDAAVLHVLNALADMDLALLNSGKSRRAVGFSFVFPAGTNQGEFSSETEEQAVVMPFNDPEYIRFQSSPTTASSYNNSGWNIIDTVDNIGDLTRAQESGQMAVLVSNRGSIPQYLLSFVPQTDLPVEIWGQASSMDASMLTEQTTFPAEYTHKAAVDAALMMLDELLLLEDAGRYQAFVQSRTPKLLKRQRTLNYCFDTYRSESNDARFSSVSDNYDIFAREEFGNGNHFNNFGGW